MKGIPFSLEIDHTRLEIRNALEQFIKLLHDDNGLPIRDIIAEMLLYSSLAIADEDVDISNGISMSFNIGDDEFSDEEANYELESAKNDLKYFKKDVKKLAKNIEKEKVDKWELSRLAERAEELQEEYEEDIIEQLDHEIEEIHEMLAPLLKEGEIICAKTKLQDACSRMIYNISSIKSIVSDVDEALSDLEQNGALEYEHEEMAKEAKERCAVYRAKKKMLDVEIAENSGNYTKALKLKAEANALLMQDWKSIMKDTNYPDVDYLSY